MNLDKRGLDERQRALRNRVGYQCFQLLLYCILIDTMLYGAGVKWLPYPANMMALISLCGGLYQVRIIQGNAYLPPGSNAAGSRRKITVIVLFTVAVAAVAAVVIVRNNVLRVPGVPESGDQSALVLFIISGVSLLVALIVGIAQRRQDKENEGE